MGTGPLCESRCSTVPYTSPSPGMRLRGRLPAPVWDLIRCWAGSAAVDVWSFTICSCCCGFVLVRETR